MEARLRFPQLNLAPRRSLQLAALAKIAGGSRRITNNIPLSLSSAYALCRPSQSRVNALPSCSSYGLVDTSDYGVLLLQRVSAWHSSLPKCSSAAPCQACLFQSLCCICFRI
jgi:hypothetical protein